MINFNTTNSTFRQLLGNGLTYRVPPFQRDYSWTEEEWEDLWQDILGLFTEDGEPAHYMGYLVLQSSNNKQFDIIDGQQRMTTISILILSGLAYLDELIHHNLDSTNNQLRRDNLRNSYIGYVNPITLIPQSKLKLNRHNDRFYQNYLVPLSDNIPKRNLNSSEHLLRKAFEWFKVRCKGKFGLTEQSGQNFTIMLDSLVDKLFFTVITVTDELNAFRVFETLNARGVRLSATDLLKNYLFSIISKGETHEAELKSLEDRWERVVELLGSESFPEFLRVFWNSRHPLVRKADLFKTIRRHIHTIESAFALLRDLDYFASVYVSLRNPFDSLWEKEEREALQELQLFNVRQPLAMLMACYQRFFEVDRVAFRKILRAISIFSFRYNIICSLPSNEQENFYNEIARSIFNQTYDTYGKVLSALQVLYPNDDIFKTAFVNKELRTGNSRNKRIVRYIFFAIEQYRSKQDFDTESAIYNLEHILPENPSEAWDYINEAQQERFIYRLGNMTILETKRNRDLGNVSYGLKRPIYAESVLQITQAIAEHYDIWNEAKIEARQKQLAKIALQVWRIDFFENQRAIAVGRSTD